MSVYTEWASLALQAVSTAYLAQGALKKVHKLYNDRDQRTSGNVLFLALDVGNVALNIISTCDLYKGIHLPKKIEGIEAKIVDKRASLERGAKQVAVLAPAASKELDAFMEKKRFELDHCALPSLDGNCHPYESVIYMSEFEQLRNDISIRDSKVAGTLSQIQQDMSDLRSLNRDWTELNKVASEIRTRAVVIKYAGAAIDVVPTVIFTAKTIIDNRPFLPLLVNGTRNSEKISRFAWIIIDVILSHYKTEPFAKKLEEVQTAGSQVIGIISGQAIAFLATAMIKSQGLPDHIPEKVSDDPVLRRYVCPISAQPIRFPLILEEDGHSFMFEAKYIIAWHQACIDGGRSGTNPHTRNPFLLTDLREAPEVRTEIENRLFELKCNGEYDE